MPFTIGCFPFYSVILGFLRYHWFSLFALLGIRTNVVSATLVAGPFLIFHYFILLRFPLQKSLLTFLFLGCPRGLTFGLSSFKAYRFHIFRPTFWLLFPLSFFPSELISSYQTKRSLATFLYGSSSWVPLHTRPLLMSCWFARLLIPFLDHWVADRDISIFVLRISWHALLNCLNPNLALLLVPRIPGS